MNRGAREANSSQIVLEAVRDIHDQEQDVTREALFAATGLPRYIVDERLRVLTGDGFLIRASRGKYIPAETFMEPRAMSKTIVPGGTVKYEVGDDLIELTHAEDPHFVGLVAGSTCVMFMPDAEVRTMTKGVTATGHVKYEIGSHTMLLTPHEDRMLAILAAGSATQLVAIQNNHHTQAINARFAQRLDRVEKLQRDRNRRANVTSKKQG